MIVIAIMMIAVVGDVPIIHDVIEVPTTRQSIIISGVHGHDIVIGTIQGHGHIGAIQSMNAVQAVQSRVMMMMV